MDLALTELGRTSAGAEHFPILVELASIPSRKDEMPRPEPDAADLAKADAMIQDART